MKKRKGLFLSVELMIFIIVVTVIIAMVAAGIPMMGNLYKVKIITKDIGDLRTAVGIFFDSYGRYPGDYDSSSAVGGKMANSVLKTDIAALAAVSSTLITTNEKTIASGYISGAKNPIAYKQIYTDGYKMDAGIAIDKAVDYTTNTLTSYFKNGHMAGPMKSTVWYFSVDSYGLNSSTTTALNNSILPSTVYSTEYAKTWAGNFKASLINLSGYSVGSASINPDMTQNIAAISAFVAKGVESKIDDGTPYALQTDSVKNTVAGEGIGGPTSTSNGCTSLSAAISSISDMTAATYKDSKVATPSGGCVLHVLVTGPGIQEVVAAS